MFPTACWLGKIKKKRKRKKRISISRKIKMYLCVPVCIVLHHYKKISKSAQTSVIVESTPITCASSNSLIKVVKREFQQRANSVHSSYPSHQVVPRSWIGRKLLSHSAGQVCHVRCHSGVFDILNVNINSI